MLEEIADIEINGLTGSPILLGTVSNYQVILLRTTFIISNSMPRFNPLRLPQLRPLITALYQRGISETSIYNVALDQALFFRKFTATEIESS